MKQARKCKNSFSLTAESFWERWRMPLPPMTSSTDKLQPCWWWTQRFVTKTLTKCVWSVIDFMRSYLQQLTTSSHGKTSSSKLVNVLRVSKNLIMQSSSFRVAYCWNVCWIIFRSCLGWTTITNRHQKYNFQQKDKKKSSPMVPVDKRQVFGIEVYLHAVYQLLREKKVQANFFSKGHIHIPWI